MFSMNLIVIGEWGGAWNVDTVNKLLAKYSVELSSWETVLSGEFEVNGWLLLLRSGGSMVKFP
jgi:hypothetical protein